MRGRVLFGTNNIFTVQPEHSSETVFCSLKGKKLKGLEGYYNALAAGDWVEWESDGHGQGVITALVPRKTLFWRYNEKGRAKQAIAANMDYVVCVSSADMPPFRPRFIDRLSLEPAALGLPFVIVLNKADMGIDEEISERLEDYSRIGFRVVVTSTETGEGIDELMELVKGKCSVFAGQSGVGKSSILNAFEDGLGLKTGEICEKYSRGRHTTVAAVLLTLQDGMTEVIDTPGFRRFAVRGIPPMDLAACFPEIHSASLDCALGARCSHQDEPDCAVVKAAEDGHIHPDRYESYLRIFYELEDNPAWKERGARGRGRARYMGDDYE